MTCTECRGRRIVAVITYLGTNYLPCARCTQVPAAGSADPEPPSSATSHGPASAETECPDPAAVQPERGSR